MHLRVIPARGIRLAAAGVAAPLVLVLILALVRLIQRDSAGVAVMAAVAGSYLVLAAPVLAWLNRRVDPGERVSAWSWVLLSGFGASLAGHALGLGSGWQREMISGLGLACVIAIAVIERRSRGRE